MHKMLGVILVLFSAAPVLAAEKDIVDTAVAANFNTLVAAVKAADLVDTLKGSGPFTVFAPTDEAFAKLPKGTVDDLLKPENKDKLKAILTYHVVSGKVMAADVVKLDGKEVKTVQGSLVAIKVDGGAVMVGDAKVTKTDIEASDGVIHVIDTVLLPPAGKNAATAAPAQGFNHATPWHPRYAPLVAMPYDAATQQPRLSWWGVGRRMTTRCGR
jgi:uncharacterized surface protein with fasciclin (FAS1) repeats